MQSHQQEIIYSFLMSFNKMVQWKVGNNCVICDTGKEVEFGDKHEDR